MIYRKPEWPENVQIEFRTGKGHGVVIPPSIHPDTHQTYQWVEGYSLFDLPLIDIPETFYQRILRDLSISKKATVPKVEKERLKFGIDGRNNDAFKKAIVLAKTGIFSEDEVCKKILDLADITPGDHPFPQGNELEATVASAFRTVREGNTGDMERDGLTDLGNAEKLIGQYGKDLRYCKKWKKWFIWDGIRWGEDDRGEIEQKAEEVIKGMYNELGNIPDPRSKTEHFKHAKRSEMSNRINGMITLAQNQKGIPILPDQLDTDSWLLNVNNGTLNLKAGELQPHRREDLITKLAPVEYDPAAECPFWISHLNKIFNNNGELVAFLMMALGYSLTGNTDERKMFIAYGEGRNGKSVTLEPFQDLMGDYATTISPEKILVKKYGGDPQRDMAPLKGMRMVNCSEIGRERRLSESLIKNITGQDTLEGRFLYAEKFDFKPNFKLWLRTNHEPIIKDLGKAMWDRIVKIPFNIRLTEKECIPRAEMDERLKEEWSGILTWALHGIWKWQRHKGLCLPDEVIKATEEYREEMDNIKDFLDECCNKSSEKKVSVGNLRNAYSEWCKKNGDFPTGKKDFSKRINELGFDTRKMSGVWYFTKLEIKGGII